MSGMTTRQKRRLERTGHSMPRWHRRLESKLGVVFGYYRVPRVLCRGPLGMLFVGPMGPNVSPGKSYREAWKGARGAELTVLGHSLYFEKNV